MEGVFQAKRRSIKKALWLKWSLMHFRSWKAILAITQQEEKDGLWWTWRRRQGCSEGPEKEVIRFAFKWFCCCCLLLLFRCSVVSMSDSLQPHGFHHTMPPCPSPTPRAYLNSCPSNQWCHPTISSSSPSPPTFSLSQHQDLIPMSLFFASGGQSIGVSASASVLPMNIQNCFPLGLAGLISFGC